MTLDEIVRRVPWWQGETASSAGKQIWRYAHTYGWFRDFVETGRITRGPYRLIPDPIFEPSRDAANEFIATPRMPTRLRGSSRARRRQHLSDTELQAYDILTQYGVYLPAVIDLIIQRLGDPARLRDPEERLTANRILVTIAKNRGQPEQARRVATGAIKLARRLGRTDDVAYLLDQVGCAYHIEEHYEEAQRFFEEEIAFLESSDSPRASFHLASAYRALAMTLHARGQEDNAREAIRQSAHHAELSHHDEARGLARLVEARFDGPEASLELVGVLRQLPLGDRVGQIMFLNTIAERLLRRGDHSGGQEILQHAYDDARRLDIRHVIARCRAIADKNDVELDDSNR